jgi:phosphoenolpyruvate---glycerone phosphotransferase subunit DhaL|tara:strand:- start:1426 stop:2037 length:612 start_codon:yes stop_codon:yes gene_type:complete
MNWNTKDLQNWLCQCADRMIASAPELNELDGQLGDGDLGATLEKCGKLMQDGLSEETDTPADVFKVCAMACSRASGSSFGTLMAVAFMTLAKETNGKNALACGDVEPLLGKVLEALMARGKASLGDKTMLDSIEAIRLAAANLTESAALPKIAVAAASSAQEEYRDKPNRIGRARMFAEKSIGLNDPGMVAVVRIISSGRDQN